MLSERLKRKCAWEAQTYQHLTWIEAIHFQIEKRNYGVRDKERAISCVFRTVGAACTPSCIGSFPGEKVADPFDCTKYYICGPDETLSEISYSCEPGTFFGNSSCDAVSCKQLCGACQLTCYDNITYVGDPSDCSVFYECGIVQGPPQTCPGHIPYFDSVNSECTDNSTVCCVPSCTPICPVMNVLIPDPADCTKYYYCTDAPPYPLFSCGSGEVFDIGNGACSPTAECIVMCPGGTRPPLVIPENFTTTSIPVTTISTITNTTGISSTTPGTGTCLPNFICPDSGFYPACQSCDPKYFYCESQGLPGLLRTCSSGHHFNTVPEYAFCIDPDLCPYHP
ncbi:hypothetical protein SK128_015257 [Halocaridina rubra]|uniref:Chitin-binding type-2 domain-containing protein n=1 Tax=Halocaridina rubra TaxID=373956 RepID=A0AAN9FTY6_HALRR